MSGEQDIPPDLQVIIPNLHWRYSGVTATNRAVSPQVAKLIPAVWFGRDAPEGIARLSFRDFLKLWMRREPLLWHARRNDEMIVGLLFKALGWRLRPIFTSAAQRHHTWITRFLISRMEAIIATSAASATYLKREATVIHHGVDSQVYRPAEDRAAAVREAKLHGRYAIGCFGRVRAQKGTDLFVEAMCELLPRYPDFAAVIVGAITPDHVAFADALKAKIAAAHLQSRILILGERPIEEIPRWFRRLTIYAFTSRKEGFGLTLIEAMASGAALVASREGAAEIAVRDGETGVLVPSGDAKALIAALEPLLQDPAQAEEMGRRGRARAVAEFGLDREAQSIVEVYRSVLAR